MCIHAQTRWRFFFVLRSVFLYTWLSKKAKTIRAHKKKNFGCQKNLFACCRASCSAFFVSFLLHECEWRSETRGCSGRSTCWQPPQLILSCITFTRQKQKPFFDWICAALRAFTSDREEHRWEEEKWFWEVYCLGWGASEAAKWILMI